MEFEDCLLPETFTLSDAVRLASRINHALYAYGASPARLALLVTPAEFHAIAAESQRISAFLGDEATEPHDMHVAGLRLIPMLGERVK